MTTPTTADPRIGRAVRSTCSLELRRYLCSEFSAIEPHHRNIRNLPKMDPLSINSSATFLLAICLQAVHLIQRTIETVKNARKLLVKLLSQTERLRLILEQLRSLTKQLGSRAGSLLLSYNDSEPRTTINDLNSLVRSIAEKTTFVGLQMLLNRSKAEALVAKMKTHEEEIVTVLLSIAR